MKMTKEEQSEVLSGNFVYDCAVRSSRVFSFLLLEQIPDAAAGERKLLNFFVDKPSGSRTGWTVYSGFSRPKLAASAKPKDQAIMVAADCTVAVLGAGDNGMESPIPHGDENKPLWHACFDLATIDGYVYAVGPARSVCRRVGPNNWVSIVDRKTMPKPELDKLGFVTGGFDAIDGFNASDIYCVGGKGDAWRYDGTRWYQCAVPTNMLFESVCCAGDGFVYIGMQSGSVLRGRGDKWKIIHKDEMTLAFKDMVWFEGKVWCTSDYGLWVIENGKLTEAPVPAEVKACSGNLSVGDGVMLLAGMYGATVYDGKQWNRLW